MRVARTALCLALAGSLLGAGVAGAATKPKPKPKPVCNLVKDDVGDGSGITSAEGGLDIVTADIATSAKQVTAVIRLGAKPVAYGDPNSPEGAIYYFEFSTAAFANPVYLAASSRPTGGYTYDMGDIEPSANGSTYTPKTGAVTGSLTGSVFTLTVARDVLGSLVDVKPGIKLTALTAEIFWPAEVPFVGGLLEPADDATGAKAYIAGALSCVKPGKG